MLSTGSVFGKIQSLSSVLKMNATLNALKIHRIIEHTDFSNSWVLVEHWSSQLLSGAVLPSGVRHQGVVKARCDSPNAWNLHFLEGV